MRVGLSLRGAEFQSAPLTDVRGDSRKEQRNGSQDRFQSAPLTDVRGDARDGHFEARSVPFQSAPLTDVRGDNWSRATRPSKI